jgi:hypothetical protein
MFKLRKLAFSFTLRTGDFNMFLGLFDLLMKNTTDYAVN